jgi:hypothetical protein
MVWHTPPAKAIPHRLTRGDPTAYSWHMRYVLFGTLCFFLVPLGGCEVTTDGDLAITWQFNGHANEEGSDPCGALGAHRIVIELEGPESVSDVVACDAFSAEYPLGYLMVGTSTWAFGHITRDLRHGDYDVRVFFIDEDGLELAAPEAWQGAVEIRRDGLTRVDLDFAVSTGRLTASWEIDGGAATCSQVDASSIALTVSEAGGAQIDAVQLDCDGDDYVLGDLDPGTYEVTGQLLDSGGAPLTNELTLSNLTVAVADVQSANLEFAWSDFTVPIVGNTRFELLVANVITQCSEVADLAHPSLATRMTLTDDQGAGVPAATALPNPDGQLDCAGLSGGITLDGTTLGACHDVEQIICGLQVGDYTLSVQAHDASDLLCYSADLALSVGLEVGDPAGLVLRATADATDCWL